MVPSIRSMPVLGVKISQTSYGEVTSVCRQWIGENRSGSPAPARYICVTSVHGVITAVFDEAVKADLNAADIATPDGMPVVWALRSFGARNQPRVYGPNLMLDLMKDAEQRGHRVFLYGASPATLMDLKKNLLQRFPGLALAGCYSPPFGTLTMEEDAEIIRTIRRSRADLVLVGLSTPKQERWMASHRTLLPNMILIGVGAAFDFHAGHLRQAPPWMQNHGLEWLFRLVMEPMRLWKRYLLITPIFLPLWALQKAGILRYSKGRTVA
jgi:N-acetylglucosaminyldiphosphoundecaprenol N-acetyl-beta-D-mannosaminyltransferase